MEQKNYKLEIVNELLGKPQHIRALAIKVGTNHTTIIRKIRELYNENVLDYKEEGKNKTYFLKKTPEAKNYAFMAETYKLNQILKKYPSLRNVLDKTQKNKKIKMAVLFGSYAKGLAKKESDIDIYIDASSLSLRQEIEKINSKLSVKIGKYDKNSPLIKEIEKNHVIIKGVEDFYEKFKFFE